MGGETAHLLERRRSDAVTEDHNLAQERCRRGEVSQDAAQRLPSANVLTRAVGIHKDLRLETRVAEIVAGDRYLISTDGLYKELTLETIRQMLSGPFNDQILQALIDEALNRGGRDNTFRWTGIEEIVDVASASSAVAGGSEMPRYVA